MESNIEEVKVLQTTALLLTINNLVRGEALAKVIETLLGPYYELRQSINFLFLLFKHVNFKHRNSNDVFIFKRSWVDEGTYVWKPSEDPFDHTAIKSERKIEGNFKETIRFKLYLIQPLTQLSGNGFFKPFTVLGSVLSTALRQRRNHWEHGRRHSPSVGLARFRARVKWRFRVVGRVHADERRRILQRHRRRNKIGRVVAEVAETLRARRLHAVPGTVGSVLQIHFRPEDFSVESRGTICHFNLQFQFQNFYSNFNKIVVGTLFRDLIICIVRKTIWFFSVLNVWYGAFFWTGTMWEAKLDTWILWNETTVLADHIYRQIFGVKSFDQFFFVMQDLVQLVNGDQPSWLVGMTEMTRTFGIELLENVLTVFHPVFFRVSKLTQEGVLCSIFYCSNWS